MALRKLSDADKQEILTLYRQPEHTTSTLASRYGVSNSTISRLLKAQLPKDEYSALIQQKRNSGDKPAAANSSDAADSSESTSSAAPAKPKTRKKSSSRAKSTATATDTPPPPDPQPSPETAAASSPPKEKPKLKSKAPEITDEAVETPQADEPTAEKPASQSRRRRSRRQKSGDADGEQLSLPQQPEAGSESDQTRSDQPPADADEVDEDVAASLIDEDFDSDEDTDDDYGDDDEFDGEDDGDSDDEDWHPTSAAATGALQINPLTTSALPRMCYVVVDRSSADLVTCPLKDFSDLGEIPEDEKNARTLPIFDNHRVARRFSRRNQRVIKVPDGGLLQTTSNYLQAKGITRLLIDGQVYTIEAEAEPVTV